MQKLKTVSKRKLVLFIVFALLVLCIPFYIKTTYTLKIICNVMLYSIVALSINLIVGFCGQLDFGRAAFVGLGAYFSAVMVSKLHVPFMAAFIGAGIFSAFFGLLLGLLCRYTSFDYLTLITMGFSEIVRIILLNWQGVTNGSFGIATTRPSFFGFVLDSHQKYFYFALVLLSVTFIAIKRITRSKYGRAFQAIKDDSIAAAYAGINVANYKMLCFTVSSFFTGIAGSAMVHYTMFTAPTNYTLDESIIQLQMAILGGLGSLPGSIIGSAVLVIVPEISRAFYQYRLLFVGIIMVILMLFAPNGLLGRHGIKDQLVAWNKKRKAKAARGGATLDRNIKN